MGDYWKLYYNFIRTHMSLDGRTPSEEAGITVEGDNKWLTLMRKSIKYLNTQQGKNAKIAQKL